MKSSKISFLCFHLKRESTIKPLSNPILSFCWFFFAGITFYLGFHFSEIHQVDQFVYLNLQEIQSLNHYLTAIKTNQIVDLQPIRDLSFYLDGQLSKIFGLQIYFLTNLMFFTGSLLLFRSLTRMFFERVTSSLFLAMFLVHPLFWRINTQIISRKYLLATFFALATLYFVKRIEKRKRPLLNYSLSFLMFLCSLGSHPLLLGVPFLLLVDNYSRTKKIIPTSKSQTAYLVLILLVTLPWIYLYHQHASQVFQEHLGFNQISLQLDILDQMLALGRYFIQLFLPLSFAEFYYKWSWLNFLGAALLPVFLYGVAKSLPKFVVLFYSSWIIVGILLPLISIDSLFIRDGYFLFSSIGFIALVEFLYKKYESQLIVKNIAIILIVGLMGLSIKEIPVLINRDLQVAIEYKREPSCQALIILLHHHLDNREYEKLNELGPEMISRKCIWTNRQNFLTAQKLYLFITAQTDKLQYEQKIALLERSSNQFPELKTSKIMAAVIANQYEDAINFMSELSISSQGDPFLVYARTRIKKDCQGLKSSPCSELDELIKNFIDRPSL